MKDHAGSAGSHILFAGCALPREGAAVQHATVALARQLRLGLWEAPTTGCCGARQDLRVSADARRKTLAPVYDAAQRGPQGGMDVVCLSPACRRVVSACAPSSHIHVYDPVTALTEVYGLPRLASRATAGLSGLRVALHASCHHDHNVAVAEAKAVAMADGAEAGRRDAGFIAMLAGRLLGGARSQGDITRTNQPATRRDMQALHDVVAATGAAIADDVSAAAGCAERPLLGRGPARSSAADAAPCLPMAVEAGAQILVTPCFLCFIGLNALQRRVTPGDPIRSMPVLHLSQFVGVACEASPGDLDLARITASPRPALYPYLT